MRALPVRRHPPRRSFVPYRIATLSSAAALPVMTMALIMAILLSACGQATDDVGESEEGGLVLGHTEEREVTERGVAPGGRLLVLEGYHGNISLEATSDRFATLEFEKTARGDDSEGALRLLDEVDITEEGSDDAYRYVIQSSDNRRTAVNVRGTMPEGTNLQIQWESGLISLSGPDGPLQIRNGSGGVQVAGIADNADIRVNNGAIFVGVEDLPSNTTIELETSNGDVTVSLPSTASARIEAQTSAGAVQISGLSFVDRSLDPEGAGAEFNGQMGQGNANIRLLTENGSIYLNEGGMDRLPAGDTLQVPVDTASASPADTITVPPSDTAAAPAAGARRSGTDSQRDTADTDSAL